ncbi:MAG: DUF1858 domain-containing protein [Defluviitaleaceae bacterium]|nr:DUF1858 domain-containing protein [Defluviitaleaceae bacterium]
MQKIHKDMTINEIIAVDRGIVAILLNSGMHCVGCPMSQRETLAEAGFVHGEDVDALVEEINGYLEAVNA